MVVVAPKTSFQTKYIVKSNQTALITNATQPLTFNFNCNSFASGCKPKKNINGKKSKSLDGAKIQLKIQVAKYAKI